MKIEERVSTLNLVILIVLMLGVLITYPIIKTLGNNNSLNHDYKNISQK